MGGWWQEFLESRVLVGGSGVLQLLPTTKGCPKYLGSARGSRAAVGGPPTARSAIQRRVGEDAVWLLSRERPASRRAAAKGTPAACAPRTARSAWNFRTRSDRAPSPAAKSLTARKCTAATAAMITMARLMDQLTAQPHSRCNRTSPRSCFKSFRKASYHVQTSTSPHLLISSSTFCA